VDFDTVAERVDVGRCLYRSPCRRHCGGHPARTEPGTRQLQDEQLEAIGNEARVPFLVIKALDGDLRGAEPSQNRKCGKPWCRCAAWSVFGPHVHPNSDMKCVVPHAVHSGTFPVFSGFFGMSRECRCVEGVLLTERAMLRGRFPP